MLRRQISGLILGVFVFLSAFPQLPKFPQFRILTLDDGLPQSGVYNILQDRKGYIWMLTGEGLCRYDGYRFKVFKHDKEDSTSLKAGTCISVIEDKEGYLWVVYRSSGLSRMNPVTGACVHYTHRAQDSSSLCSDDVRVLCKDEAGNIYAGTARGLSIIDASSKRFSRIIFKREGKELAFDENSIWALLCDKDRLWVGTYRSGGLHCVNLKNKSFRTFKSNEKDPASLVNNYVVALQKDSNEDIWISTRGGLCVYHPRTDQFTRYYYDANNANSPSSNDLWGGLLVDHHNNVWIGSFADGFTFYSAARKKFSRVQHHPDIPNSLSSNALRCIFEDASGMIWLGTANGLNIYDPRHESFTLLRNVSGDASTLSGKQINCMYMDRQERLWLAIANEGIDVYDTKTGRMLHLKHQDKIKTSLPVSNVRGFSEDKDGVMHIAAFGCPAVCSYDEGRNIFKHIGGCWGNGIQADQSGKIWAASTFGLGPSDSLDKYPINNLDSTALGGRVINYLAREGKDHFWIAAGQVLNHFNIKTRKSRRFKFEDHIFCVHKDSKNRFWAGTTGGLTLFDFETLQPIRTITAKNGIANDVVSAIEEDAEGYLWLGTNKGISRYHPDKGTAINFDVRDGLPNNECNGGSISHKGKFYFGSMNGVSIFDPSAIRRNDSKAPLVITMLTVLNEPVVLEQGEEIPSITLTNDQYFFSIEFALLDFADPRKNQYAYKLEGFHDDWVQIGNKHEVTFTNLNPGTYTFMAKGANNHGTWNENSSRLLITVLPPWWKTSWFYSLAAFTIVLSIYGYIKYRESKLRAEKKLLEDKVKERTAEVVQQKEIIEEKHKEITDSINYAQRIQRSLLASDALLNENLQEHFIVFKPKDVVSGDFYWAGTLSNGDFALVTADSTGHGVPGAIMSMLNISCLEKSVEAEKLNEPADILNHTRRRVIETLAKDGSAEGGKDGMDCCIVVFDKNKQHIRFSAANNNLWLLREGQLLEFKADKMPVGRHDKQQQPFSQQQIALQKGDVIYTYTDGLADQFGGSEGKKFKASRLKELLVRLHGKSMQEQQQAIAKEFADWKGNVEQVDDVLVIGVRV